MKHMVLILAVGLVAQTPAFSQGALDFGINYGGNPPPHTPGVPDSGAILTNGVFSAALYLNDATPTAGSIVDQSADGSFTTVFPFTSLVYATYPGGGPALDYEGSWPLTASQTQELLAGQWYAEITYGDATYFGQIAAVPEPSGLPLLVV
jgi:hypothetical protein